MRVLASRIVVVGAGHMGRAIVVGLQKEAPETPIDIVEISESRIRLIGEEFGIDSRSKYEPEQGDVVIVAIPPQAFEEFCAAQSPEAFAESLVVSVMAGVSIAAVERGLGASRVVRTIPNTPSEVSRGMTVLCPGTSVTDGEISLAEQVMSVIGKTVTVRDEALVDDATALCGGGPAFIAHIAGSFIDFAVKAGFDRGQARLMTTQVLRGTADLMDVTGREPEEMCRQVMTPGGTTEQGIFHFRDNGLHDLLVEGLDRSARRSRELGQIGR